MNSFFRGLDRGFTCGLNTLCWGSMPFGFSPCTFNMWNFSMPIFNTPTMGFGMFPSFSVFTPMPMAFSAPMFTPGNYSFFNYTPQNYGFDSFSFNNSSSRNIQSKDKKKPSEVPHYTKITEEEMQRIYNKQYDYDITTASNLTAEQINKFIETKYPNSALKGKGQAFVDAENKYGISALAMLGICGIETGFGTVGHATDGLNNPVNIQRKGYDPAVHGKDRFRKFDSIEDCIMELARLLKENYVDSSGNKQVPHFTKLYQINAKYCPASEKASQAGWAKSVTSKMNEVKQAIGI